MMIRKAAAATKLGPWTLDPVVWKGTCVIHTTTAILGDDGDGARDEGLKA